LIYPYLGIGLRAPVIYGCVINLRPRVWSKAREAVSRSKTLERIEHELYAVRERARHPDDAMLRYLIDMAIEEARGASSQRDEAQTLSVSVRHRGAHRAKLTVCGPN
jgi:hypothetical protein